MNFDINPPIKSNAASISFWLFTTKVPKNLEDTKIYHMTLEDFFVVTIIPDETEYKIYAIGYEMYHEAYGQIIKDISDKNAFVNFFDGHFPYKKWVIRKNICKINRWVNIIVSYNKNLARISIQILYQKRNENDGINIFEEKPLDGEYIYIRSDENDLKMSRLHFKKFYRNSDTTHLNIKIYNNNIGVYFRKIYVFVTELLIKDKTKNLFGFQYIEFEKIFTNENNLMPELVLAVPFENITKSGVDDKKYFIEYFIYDMTKIYNNRNKKYLEINPGYIENTLYKYSPGLYRLNLLTGKNKKFESITLDTIVDFTCLNNNYCYISRENNIYNYACLNGFIHPASRGCTTDYDGMMLVPGINALNNMKGTLTKICYGEGCSANSLTDFNCDNINHKKIFDACVDLPDDFMGYFYYSYFFKLPPIKFDLRKTYINYTIQFNFLYETNSFLRPKNKLNRLGKLFKN